MCTRKRSPKNSQTCDIFTSIGVHPHQELATCEFGGQTKLNQKWLLLWFLGRLELKKSTSNVLWDPLTTPWIVWISILVLVSKPEIGKGNSCTCLEPRDWTWDWKKDILILVSRIETGFTWQPVPSPLMYFLSLSFQDSVKMTHGSYQNEHLNWFPLGLSNILSVGRGGKPNRWWVLTKCVCSGCTTAPQ